MNEEMISLNSKLDSYKREYKKLKKFKKFIDLFAVIYYLKV